MQFAQTGGDADMNMELAMKMAMANMNPFKRKTDKPVAYWSGIVDIHGEKLSVIKFQRNLTVT